LLESWRWLVIFRLTFAAIATPTPDPVTMAMVALPFMAIVLVALVVMMLNDLRRARRERRVGSGKLSDDEASDISDVGVTSES
jgi:sec-independent protein translocase protein TatC